MHRQRIDKAQVTADHESRPGMGEDEGVGRGARVRVGVELGLGVGGGITSYNFTLHFLYHG